MKKALIAMSGGVDSSVAAKLMLDAGYDCMGATMKLFDSDDILMAQREKTCCSLSEGKALLLPVRCGGRPQRGPPTGYALSSVQF
ncbi:tRNA-specific 2-thiouridylase MnmA [Clostridium sp. CAG:217]|nr:tRNA-specific 2-thiouridylase MnmA [Clostridium sp. CAG:217]